MHIKNDDSSGKFQVSHFLFFVFQLAWEIFYRQLFIIGQNGGATTSISSLRTGWVNFIWRECSEMLPSGFERGAPYFKSPLITHPMAESCALI